MMTSAEKEVNSENLGGKAVGERYVTHSRDPDRLARIEWKQGRAWRLRKVRSGNQAWALPGTEELLDVDKINAIRKSNRVLIVVGSSHGGLSSFTRWLSREASNPITVDLSAAQLAGSEPTERLRRIGLDLRRASSEIPTAEELDPELQTDPIELLRWLAETPGRHRPRTAIFRNLSSLDPDTASRFFGRIRGLYEDPDSPLANLNLILLGRSIRPLDPEEKQPVSTLLSVSEVWTPTPLRRQEVEQLAALRLDLDVESLKRVWEWAGGEPLVVQGLFELIDSEDHWTISDVEEAIAFLERERLPAFETWRLHLTERLREDHEIQILLRQLLRTGSVENDDMIRRVTLLELFVDGWLRPEPTDAQIPQRWRFRSECRKFLAGESYADR